MGVSEPKRFPYTTLHGVMPQLATRGESSLSLQEGVNLGPQL